MSAGRAPTFGTMVFVLFGPLIWAGHLLVAYGGHASLCEFEVLSLWGFPVVPVLLWGATGGALLALIFGLLWPGSIRRLLRAENDIEDENRWLEGLMRLLAALSLFGVVYAALAIFMVPYCGQLR
jgi:hypothetical protein